jgi:hypothetical protein
MIIDDIWGVEQVGEFAGWVLGERREFNSVIGFISEVVHVRAF